MTSIHHLIDRIGEATPVDVVMDVGAHVGNDSLPVAHDYPGVEVFAVEPTPSLAERLREASRGLPNYTVIEAAIATEEEERTFNLVGRGLAGLNSLNEYAPGVERVVKGLPPVTERIRVHTKRLETICDEEGIAAIDILHVDTQGSDIDVLLSLGERLSRLKAGAIEVSNRLRLYVTSVDRDEAWAQLTARGFVVVDIQPVNRNRSEQNLLFVRRGLERGLLARGAPGLLYRALVLRCYLRTTSDRVRPVLAELRTRVALRTRIRRWVGRQGEGGI